MRRSHEAERLYPIMVNVLAGLTPKRASAGVCFLPGLDSNPMVSSGTQNETPAKPFLGLCEHGKGVSEPNQKGKQRVNKPGDNLSAKSKSKGDK